MINKLQDQIGNSLQCLYLQLIKVRKNKFNIYLQPWFKSVICSSNAGIIAVCIQILCQRHKANIISEILYCKLQLNYLFSFVLIGVKKFLGKQKIFSNDLANICNSMNIIKQIDWLLLHCCLRKLDCENCVWYHSQ